MVPVHKKGDLNDLGNYHSISITPPLSKIFEMVTKNRLNKFLEKNMIIYPSQFGFRENSCTIQAVSSIVEDRVMGLDEGKT